MVKKLLREPVQYTYIHVLPFFFFFGCLVCFWAFYSNSKTMLFAPFFGAFTFCLWTRYVYAIAYFHTFDGSFLVMFDVCDLCFCQNFCLLTPVYVYF